MSCFLSLLCVEGSKELRRIILSAENNEPKGDQAYLSISDCNVPSFI